MISREFLLFCLLILSSSVFSQSIIIPHTMDVDVDVKEGEERIDNIEFYEYVYSGEKIDIRDIKRMNPKLEAPDFIHITAPDLTGFETVNTLMGVMAGEKLDSNAIVIWIVGNYYTNEVTFFVDINMDRNYLNDGQSLQIKAGQNAKRVIIYPYGDKTNGRELRLKVPRKPKFKGFSQFGNRKVKIGYQLALGLHAGFGSGSLNYEFDNLERGFPTWYTVNFSEKSFGASLTYSLPRFRFGIIANYQNHFYYTSYLNIRYDNPMIVIDQVSGQRRRIENVLVERNQDDHSRNKVQWGLLAAYRMHIGETLELQPTVTVGKASYLTGEYVADRRFEDQTYTLPSSTFVEGGLQMEVTTGLHRAFYLGIFYNNVWWEPQDFYATVPHENLQSEYKNWTGRLGYRIAFGK
jgi:hypothetical protein